MSSTNNNSRLEILEIEKKEIEIDKLNLEKIKISLENKELSKSSFKKINWAAILIPLALSIVPVIYLLLSGIFDSKYQEYKANKAILELDQRNFIQIGDSLENKIVLLQDSLNQITFLLSKKQDSSKNIIRDIRELNITKNLLITDLKNRDSLVLDLTTQRQNCEIKADSMKLLKRNLEIEKADLLATIQRMKFSLSYVNTELFKCNEKNNLLNDEIKAIKKN